MPHEPSRARTSAPKAKASGASCVACMVFVAGMGAAFWLGTFWASQSWIAFTR
jgi:hypothetical protein